MVRNEMDVKIKEYMEVTCRYYSKWLGKEGLLLNDFDGIQYVYSDQRNIAQYGSNHSQDNATKYNYLSEPFGNLLLYAYKLAVLFRFTFCVLLIFYLHPFPHFCAAFLRFTVPGNAGTHKPYYTYYTLPTMYHIKFFPSYLPYRQTGIMLKSEIIRKYYIK